jgi:integrase/recombinase XerD
LEKHTDLQNASLDAKAEQYEQSREKSTLEKLFDQFIREKRYLANLAPRTLDSYTEIFARYLRFVGHDLPTDEILNNYVMGMREAGLSVTTCNISIRSFNSFLTWLHKNGHIPRLRMQQLKGAKRVMKTFSDEQLRVLLSWKPNMKSRNEIRAHVLILFLLDTGCRINEALSLKMSKVNLENLLVTVRGKGNRERTIPISIEMRRTLYRYISKHRQSLFPSEFVFCTSNGTMWTYQNACRELFRICRSLDIDMDNIDGAFHAFRRKFARNYVRQGGNLMYLQQVMGHTTLAMTKEYVTAEEEELQEVQHKTSILGRILGKK